MSIRLFADIYTSMLWRFYQEQGIRGLCFALAVGWVFVLIAYTMVEQAQDIQKEIGS